MLNTETFPLMHEIVPPGEVGEAKVDHYEVSAEELKLHNLRASFGREDYMEPGKYARLYVKKALMMTDTAMERSSHSYIVHRANGSVLVGGLGLGMVACGLAKKEEVKRILVIEKSQDVITLVGPHIKNFSNKIEIINADILEFKTKEKFDTIWMDIWENICADNLPEYSKLNRKFARNLNKNNPNHHRAAWMEERLKYYVRRDRNRYF